MFRKKKSRWPTIKFTTNPEQDRVQTIEQCSFSRGVSLANKTGWKYKGGQP